MSYCYTVNYLVFNILLSENSLRDVQDHLSNERNRSFSGLASPMSRLDAIRKRLIFVSER
jgi:hypothetical protein